jgi:hypothetical protein
MSEYLPNFQEKNKVTEMKVLGVYIQACRAGQLKWEAHYNYVKQKMNRDMGDLRRIVKSTYGISFEDAIGKYRDIIGLSMTYGCEVWQNCA